MEWFHSSMTFFGCHRELEREFPAYTQLWVVPELLFLHFPTIVDVLQAFSFASLLAAHSDM